jgi:hypothetical protein
MTERHSTAPAPSGKPTKPYPRVPLLLVLVLPANSPSATKDGQPARVTVGGSLDIEGPNGKLKLGK